MNFFDHQDRARRTTRWLVLLFVLASALIVLGVDFTIAIAIASLTREPMGLAVPDLAWLAEHADLMAISSVGTIAFIGLASLVKTVSLRAGGGSVATALGGSLLSGDTADAPRRRLLNVVEEMSIAAGVPVPDVYVLEEEEGINAFAAGFTPADAAIGVTRGCVTLLDRSELQGVIAHEFSHILNGDMRLNMNLIGVLHGILLIGATGAGVLRAMTYGSRRRSRGSSRGGQGTLVVIALAAALMLIGYAGVFLGRLIKAGVSRQREFLADASAVQFTREPGGLAGALRQIGDLASGSRLATRNAEDVSHMLFGAGSRAFSRLLSTHPPLEERIRRIDPRFDDTSGPGRGERDPRGASAAATAGVAPTPPALLSLAPAQVSETVGNPTAAHVRYAESLLGSLPETLRRAMRSPPGAEALVFALLLSANREQRERQLLTIEGTAGSDAAATAAGLQAEIRGLGAHARLPLVDLALPSLRRRAPAKLDAFRALVRTLIQSDERVELFELAIVTVLDNHLEAARTPPTGVQWRRSAVLADRVPQVAALLAAMAHVGADDPSTARRAYEAGLARLPRSRWPRFIPPGARDLDFERTIRETDDLANAHKQRLVEALAAAVTHDGQVRIAEAELLRAICELLHCPLPPLVASVSSAPRRPG